MTTVILDLDGTLADTAGDLVAAANACFTARGEPAPLDARRDRLTAFRGGRAMLRLGFQRLRGAWTEAEVDADYQPLLDHYEAAMDVHSHLYPGAEAALREMGARGWAVGVCTNKPERLAEILLARLGVRDLVAGLVGADTLPVRKPDPEAFREAVHRSGGDAARAVMVGDTETDHRTARAAGVPSILVAFGPEGEGIARLGPDALLRSYDALPATVGRLVAVPAPG
jgi:phosphoglycolate phosphatase